MLIDGITLSEGSSFQNLAVASGIAFPGSPNAGEMFYRTDAAPAGLYLYNGATWEIVPTGAGGGSGSVTTVSVVTANGVSGSVANPTTTPAITLSLGAIAPSSVNTAGTVTASSFIGSGSSLTGVTAAAGSLSGSTLAAGVTTSSLTSVGTLGSLTVSGTTNAATGQFTNIGIGIAPNGTNGDLTVSRDGANTGFIAFGTGNNKYIYYDGTTFNFQGAPLGASHGFTGTLTGNASTATTLLNTRTINGVGFDGSANITVTAAANTLSGSTLAAGVTASSLTSLGTLSSLSVSGTATAGTLTAGNISVAGDIISSASATITIDPSTPGTGGLVVINGNLQVTGTTTTIDSTTVTTNDLNIEVAKNAINAAAANGGGLTVNAAVANATFVYTSATDSWTMNKSLNATLLTAAQPNVTSLGTLTSLTASGDITQSSTSARTTYSNATTSGNGGLQNDNASNYVLLYPSTHSTKPSHLDLSSNTALNLIISGAPVAGLTSTGAAITGTLSATGTSTLAAINGSGSIAISTALTGTAGTSSNITLDNYRSATNNRAVISLRRSASDTLNAHALVPAGDEIGRVGFSASDGTAFISNINITARVSVGSTPATGYSPQDLVIRGSAAGTGSGFTDYAVFSSAGLAVAGTITTGGLEVGTKIIPQNATGSATLTLSDAGKHIYTAVGGQAYVIPANASVAYPIGTAITFVNQSTSPCTIAVASDTLYYAGTAGTTGTRTLGQYGVATAMKVTSTVWIISGASLS